MENTALQLFVSTIKNDGDDIFIKPVCDFFKIDTENQVLKIKNDPILTNCYGKNSNKRELFDALNKRYQYSIPFDTQNQIT